MREKKYCTEFMNTHEISNRRKNGREMLHRAFTKKIKSKNPVEIRENIYHQKPFNKCCTAGYHLETEQKNKKITKKHRGEEKGSKS